MYNDGDDDDDDDDHGDDDDCDNNYLVTGSEVFMGKSQTSVSQDRSQTSEHDKASFERPRREPLEGSGAARGVWGLTIYTLPSLILVGLKTVTNFHD